MEPGLTMTDQPQDRDSGARDRPEDQGSAPGDLPEDRDSAVGDEDFGPPGRDVILMFAVFFEGGLAPFSLFLGWILGHPPLAQFAWSWRDGLLGAGAALPLILLFLAMMRWPVGPLEQLRKFCDDEVIPLFAHSYWSEIALVAIAAGVGEEMLFRGVVQASLCGWLGTRLGLTLSSLIFGLLHPISLVYIAIAAFLGFYMGAVWIANGNLLTPMVTHAVYDFAVLGYLVRIRAGG
jgi:membrane protease YdiL (CAAX protease family)